MSQGFAAAQPSPSSQSKNIPLAPAEDCKQVQEQFLSHFDRLDDPRGKQGQAHVFISIVAIAILATIGGAQGWESIETYGLSHQTWLETFLALPHGIPSADTYRRVFERLQPEALQQCFRSWVDHIIDELGAQVIPIDGKCLKGSYDRNQKQSALHVVSAWASEHRLVLGQVKVESKSNEITAIPALLELLDIKGSTITIDAMGTQTQIAERIIAKQANYVLCLKANHPTLHAQVQQWFEAAQAQNFDGIEHSYERRVEAAHHRREIRQVWAVPVSEIENLYQSQCWAGLKSVVMVVRVRHLWNKTTREVQYYLSSLPCDAPSIGRAIRQHWSIENQLHWVLDVTFGEDNSRIRNGHSPENLTLLRRMAIGLLNQETSFKRSLQQKTQRAGMDRGYMMQVLSANSH